MGVWDYIHFGRINNNNQSDEHEYRNLQEGLLQIASQTCNILVQVNNTNHISFNANTTNIQYANNTDNVLGNSSSNTTSHIKTVKNEQSLVLIPPSSITTSSTTTAKFNRRLTRTESAKKIISNYKDRLSTVLEGKDQAGDDDFELWDQSQMWRSEQKYNSKWNHSRWCKPSCIPITVIFTLIVLVVLLPLIENANDRALHMKHNGSSYICTDICNIQLVESIPDGLKFPNGSPKFMSTYDAWMHLIGIANETISIGSFYWTLRGSDFYNHSTAWQGENIFQQLLISGTQRNLKIRIAQSAPTKDNPNLDTEFLARRKAAEVRSVSFPKLVGGGVLHTKLWIVDDQHFYIGSANMDWRSLTQVKELGVLVTNCTCLAKDVSKIFNEYWYLGRDGIHIPSHWADEYSTKFNLNSTLKVNFNDQFNSETLFSNAPPQLSARGRTHDLDAIIHTILSAEKFVYIAVMDYFPLTLYSAKQKYWPFIDDAIRQAAVENKITVKMLISWWNHSRPEEDNYLRSLKDLSDNNSGLDIQIKRFIVPSTEDQRKIPFGRVNHNKYMVTDHVAYIGTSNWSGDYFINTAGIGLVLKDTTFDRPENETTLRTQLVSLFERDWFSEYAVDLRK